MKNTPIKSIKVITHFFDNDPECGGDYQSIEVIINNKLVEEYGDYYHDHSQDKIEGFLNGLKWCLGKIPKVKYITKADIKW